MIPTSVDRLSGWHNLRLVDASIIHKLSLIPLSFRCETIIDLERVINDSTGEVEIKENKRFVDCYDYKCEKSCAYGEGPETDESSEKKK